MDKFKEIRPIVLGVAIRNNKLLVVEGYDNVKNQTFYKCLSGGIEFLENSESALKREFQEEMGTNITVNNFLGVSENIFTYNSKNAHEIIFFYSINIADTDYKDEFDNNQIFKAKWRDIHDVKNRSKILYPEEIFKYI